MTFARTLSLFALCVGVAPASAQSVADFPGVVAEILESQKEGQISEMAPPRKQQMIKCVNGALAGMPNGRKRYVLQGTTLDEREKRFGTVLYENHAQWVQEIAHKCAGIAMEHDDDFTARQPAARP